MVSARKPHIKQSSSRLDIHVWILSGEAPAFVKMEGPANLWGTQLADRASYPSLAASTIGRFRQALKDYD